MICAFNARGFLTDPAMKSAFGLNNKADDKTIPKQLILKRFLMVHETVRWFPIRIRINLKRALFSIRNRWIPSPAENNDRAQISSGCWNDGCCNHYIAFIVGLQNSKKWIP